MATLDKINRCHDIIVESNKRIDAQLENIKIWQPLSFYKVNDCHERIKQIRIVQERLINYMRKQAMNLIVELG